MTSYSRNRSRQSPGSPDTLTKSFNGEAVVQWDNVNGASSEAIFDVVTPGYHKRIAEGEIINNPCVYSSGEDRAGNGVYHAELQSAPYDVYSTSGGSLTRFQSEAYHPNDDFWPDQVDILPSSVVAGYSKSAAIAEIDSTPYEFLEDVFEIRETLRFLKNPVTSLWSLSKSFLRDIQHTKRLKRASAIEKAEAVTDLWLTYRFAVSPLVRSIQAGAEAVQTKSRAYERPQRRTARGFSYSSDDKETRKLAFFSPSVYDEFKMTHMHERRGRAGILYEVSNPVKNVSFYLGLRAKDVPVSVWAIVPYSFMVDRVVDVSQAIRGLTNLADPRVRILAAWYVEKNTGEKTLQYTDQVNPGWDVNVVGDTVTRSFATYERAVWNPSASDAIPPSAMAGLVEDSTKIADLLALTAKNFDPFSTRR